MVGWVGVLIWLVMCAVVAALIYFDGGNEGERRYCLKCGETTFWHPKRGCEHCAWMERQW